MALWELPAIKYLRKNWVKSIAYRAKNFSILKSNAGHQLSVFLILSSNTAAVHVLVILINALALNRVFSLESMPRKQSLVLNINSISRGTLLRTSTISGISAAALSCISLSWNQGTKVTLALLQTRTMRRVVRRAVHHAVCHAVRHVVNLTKHLLPH